MNADPDQNRPLKTQKLEEYVGELEAFSYSVCHELRAPLQHIMSAAEHLSKSACALVDQDLSHLNGIVQRTEYMARIIRQLLAFSRSRHKELGKTLFSMEKLVIQCKIDLEFDFKQRKIVWDIGELPPASGDQDLMRQVVSNLLSNAVKFTRARSDARIEVGCQVKKGAPVYFIRDNGEGFDIRHYNKLFIPFQRLHADSKFEGTGIGLAIVQRIIHRHGGEIWAEGAPDQGATFFFSLPP